MGADGENLQRRAESDRATKRLSFSRKLEPEVEKLAAQQSEVNVAL